jgi:hypothetical protein
VKCGINGAEHDFNEIPCGINGAVRQASELWIGVNGAAKKVWPIIPVGYQVILDTVGEGTWTCPASGKWKIEGHGSGGAGGLWFVSFAPGGGGGGSGEEYETVFSAGQNISYRIANVTFGDGQDTTFGEYTFIGGKKADSIFGGNASGSLATSGADGTGRAPGKGGYGNKNKPTQKYGNGGLGGAMTSAEGERGEAGAIILTYLG